MVGENTENTIIKHSEVQWRLIRLIYCKLQRSKGLSPAYVKTSVTEYFPKYDTGKLRTNKPIEKDYLNTRIIILFSHNKLFSFSLEVKIKFI